MAQRATTLRIADLADRRATPFELRPEAPQREAIAQELGLLGLRKLSLAGDIRPEGKRDWRLEARLGATVVQSCSVTLEPVTTRIDEPVLRRYVAALEMPEGDTETEMPEDDTMEPLPAAVDLEQVLIEALSLSLPPFPRAEGASLGEAVYTEPGKTPMRDEDAKPFAGLAALRDKLGGNEER